MRQHRISTPGWRCGGAVAALFANGCGLGAPAVQVLTLWFDVWWENHSTCGNTPHGCIFGTKPEPVIITTGTENVKSWAVTTAFRPRRNVFASVCLPPQTFHMYLIWLTKCMCLSDMPNEYTTIYVFCSHRTHVLYSLCWHDCRFFVLSVKYEDD